jgi:hypothetical protein
MQAMIDHVIIADSIPTILLEVVFSGLLLVLPCQSACCVQIFSHTGREYDPYSDFEIAVCFC